MEVLVLAPFKEEHMARIREAAGEGAHVVQMPYDPKKFVQDDVAAELKRAEVVIGEPAARLLTDDVAVKWIQMTWAGSDIYTSRVRFPEGIAVTNVAGYAYGHTISQYVVGQILALTQNLAAYARQQTSETWRDLGKVKSLEGANVLIYGAGDIGSNVAKRLRSFDVAQIVGVCRDTSKPREHFDRLVTLSQAELQLPQADVVVCCMPQSPATHKYFNARRLERLKEDSVLVNVGRGDFIDLDALYKVLTAEQIRGVALDVTDPEPLPMRHRLWRHPRCIITPHISGGAFGHSDETEERICQVCCENLRRYSEGAPLTHQVI